MKIVCLLADGFEDIEAVGTTAILRRSGMQVDYTSVSNQTFHTGSFGTKVIVDRMLKDIRVEDYDAILIPGGRQASTLRESMGVLSIVKAFADQDKWLFAICAGPTVLGILGLLDDVRYTGFPNTENFMPKGIKLQKAAVTCGKIITGAGAGAVTEFALEIIDAIEGSTKAEQIRERILFRAFE
jgi:protein deglycase